MIYMFNSNDTLLIANAFNNFRNMCLEIYELDSARFFSAPALAWKSVLKED